MTRRVIRMRYALAATAQDRYDPRPRKHSK